jgi:predicted kinase
MHSTFAPEAKKNTAMHLSAKITPENFSNAFDLKTLLKNSVFYPASGVCGEAVKVLSARYNSFVHVDYSNSHENVIQHLRKDFSEMYDLVGITDIPIDTVIPQNFRTPVPALNEHELDRISQDQIIRDLFHGKVKPFVVWALYRLKAEFPSSQFLKAREFSILHIGGEACAVFESVYVRNKINPAAVAILWPSEGFGDNWTLFTNPDFRFYQNIVKNHRINGVPMPEVLFTHARPDNSCCWPDYKPNGETQYLEFLGAQSYQQYYHLGSNPALKLNDGPIMIMLVGIPLSGKDTLIRMGAFGDFEIISRDDVLLNLGSGNYNQDYREVPSKLVNKRFFQLMGEAAASGRNAVINATNLTVKARRKILCKFPGYQKVALVLKVPDFNTYSLRNEQRKSKEGKFMPPGVYQEMLRNYIPPHISEGIHIVKYVEHPETFNLDSLY